MNIELSYNDLEILLTKEDIQQIKEMPVPSLAQAKGIVKMWKNSYGDALVKKEPSIVKMGLIMIKPYIKARDSYPQLFI